MAKIRARGYLIAGGGPEHVPLRRPLNPLDGQIEGFDIDMLHAASRRHLRQPGQDPVRGHALTPSGSRPSSPARWTSWRTP